VLLNDDGALSDLKKITTQAESPKDVQIAKIEDDLQDERDSRKEERFAWALAVIVLVDMLAFKDLSSAGDFGIIFLELILILFLGRIFGIDAIYTIIQNALDAVSKFSRGKGGE
jgi:hypothetical protein